MNRTTFSEHASTYAISQVIERVVATLLEPASRVDGWEMPVADEWRSRLRSTCRELHEACSIAQLVNARSVGTVHVARSSRQQAGW